MLTSTKISAPTLPTPFFYWQINDPVSATTASSLVQAQTAPRLEAKTETDMQRVNDTSEYFDDIIGQTCIVIMRSQSDGVQWVEIKNASCQWGFPCVNCGLPTARRSGSQSPGCTCRGQNAMFASCLHTRSH